MKCTEKIIYNENLTMTVYDAVKGGDFQLAESVCLKCFKTNCSAQNPEW